MAEKDATARLRRAVKENNLFLVKRLITRTDMRNPDSAPKRYTSLAWAAALGHEETFEFLLSAGHDDDELSKDSENNTILMILSDLRPPTTYDYSSQLPVSDINGAALRMVRLYYDRYPGMLDWSNVHGKTALHIASLKGNEELVRMLCDLGADHDLSDNKGNTPLHYASSWGHIPIVQLLIERGCQYAARNNQGFTASDYAYSFSTRDTLQDTARAQFENNKKLRRNIFAQAAARGHEWGGASASDLPPPVPSKARDIKQVTSRLRSGSGGSRTTTTEGSGDVENGLTAHVNGNGHSLSSSPSQPSNTSINGSFLNPLSNFTANMTSAGSSGPFTMSSPSQTQPVSLHPHPNNPASALSPIATRMRERDADAMEKYLRRNRSGSSGTENGSNFSSVGPSANGDDISSLLTASGSNTPRRRLRPSISAAQLRATPEPPISTPSHPESNRNRSDTNPNPLRPHTSGSTTVPLLTRSSSTSTSSRSLVHRELNIFEELETFTGPPSQYAQFPDPPTPVEHSPDSTPTTNGRRLPFHLLSKASPVSPRSHTRGLSVTSLRPAG